MQLVGVIVGTYSSIFFATPLLVSLRERTEKVRTHTRRVLNRRKGNRRTGRGRCRRGTGGGAGCRTGGPGGESVVRPVRRDAPPASER